MCLILVSRILECHFSVQATFDGELVEPCVRQQEAMDALRAEVSLLDDPDKATRELEEFAQFSADVKNKRNRLCAAADWAKRCVCGCGCVVDIHC